MRNRAGYDGKDAQGFGMFYGELLVACQWYWSGDRYRESGRLRRFRLPARAAKSVDLYTLPEFRGRGIATVLKAQSANAMSHRGFEVLYSRIWFTHLESRRVSEKAGWTLTRIHIAIKPFGKDFALCVPVICWKGLRHTSGIDTA